MSAAEKARERPDVTHPTHSGFSERWWRTASILSQGRTLYDGIAGGNAALSDTRKREAVGRIVSRILRPHPDHDLLVEAMGRLGADSHAKGLTDEAINAELAAHKAERIR
jgi:hypothetical protein